MAAVDDLEVKTQRRVIALFRDRLGYEYLGDWRDRDDNRNIETCLLERFLVSQGHAPVLIAKAIREFQNAAALAGGRNLYEANREAYRLLRYGARVKPGVEENAQTVHLIDWKEPAANHFAVAEEVTVTGRHTKRPDLVLRPCSMRRSPPPCPRISCARMRASGLSTAGPVQPLRVP